MNVVDALILFFIVCCKCFGPVAQRLEQRTHNALRYICLLGLSMTYKGIVGDFRGLRCRLAGFCGRLCGSCAVKVRHADTRKKAESAFTIFEAVGR